MVESLEGFQKRLLSLLLAGCLMLWGTGIADALAVDFTSDLVQTKEIQLADGAIAVDIPASWRLNPKDNPFDADYVARKEFLGTGIRVGRFDELSAGMTPKDIYLEEIEGIAKPLKGTAELVELEAMEILDDKTITSSSYVVKVGGLMSFHYQVALIEFTEAADYFLVMVQGGAPKDWNQAQEKLAVINRSVRLQAG